MKRRLLIHGKIKLESLSVRQRERVHATEVEVSRHAGAPPISGFNQTLPSVRHAICTKRDVVPNSTEAAPMGV